MDAQLIKLYAKAAVKAAAFIFEQMPLIEKIAFISAFISMFNLIFGFFILMPIFNYSLIPKIEKKIGVKLMYADLYNYIPCAMGFMPPFEISFYITGRYLAWKFRGDHGLPIGRRGYALKKVSYTIDKMSKKEILLSFAFVISVISSFGFGLLMLLIQALDPSLAALNS